MILNLHGLYGTAENTNYRILIELYPVSEICSPQIAYEKCSPYNVIDGLYTIKNINFIAGNSFGGFFAYIMGAELNISCLLTYNKRLHETSCSTFVILGKDDDVLDPNFTKNYLRNAEIHEIEGNHRLSGTTYKKLFEELIRREN